jgi:DNA polymerase III subunit delta'
MESDELFKSEHALYKPMKQSFSVPFPWQQQQWTHLSNLHETDRLPHALLFVGQAGLGKNLFAMQFAKLLLCKQRQKSKMACQQCKECCLVAANTHPNLSFIIPEKVGQGIKIEQIRHFLQQLNHTTTSSYKIVIISPAENLLMPASNALLKSLEEPTERCLFILLTAKPGLLLPTIRSRCQFIRFTLPPQSLGKAWLREQLPDFKFLHELYYWADGALFTVLDYVATGLWTTHQNLIASLMDLQKKEADPIKLAENYAKLEFSHILSCLMRIVRDIIKCNFKIPIPGDPTILHFLANHLSTNFLFHYFDKLLLLQRSIKTALNQQLMLEELFCCWALGFIDHDEKL